MGFDNWLLSFVDDFLFFGWVFEMFGVVFVYCYDMIDYDSLLLIYIFYRSWDVMLLLKRR